MSVLTNLPGDVGFEILSDWVNVLDIVKLDTAYCSHGCRPYLLEFMEDVPVDGGVSSDFFKWCMLRKLILKSLTLNPSIKHLDGLDLRLVAIVAVQDLEGKRDQKYGKIVNRCTSLSRLSVMSDNCFPLLSTMTNLNQVQELFLINRSNNLSKCSQVIADSCQNLTSFRLLGAGKGTGCTKEQKIIVQNNVNLTTINVTGHVLPELSKHCPLLELVDVNGNQDDICHAVEIIATRPKLTHLNLKNNLFSYSIKNDKKRLNISQSEEEAVFYEDLIALFSSTKGFTHISYDQNSLSEEYMTEFIASCSESLVEFTEYLGDSDPECYQQLLADCSRLKTLHITYSMYSDTVLTQLFDVFAEVKPVQLENLNFIKVKDGWAKLINFSDILKLIKACSGLKECRISEATKPTEGEIDEFKSLMSERCNAGQGCNITIQCGTRYDDDAMCVEHVKGLFCCFNSVTGDKLFMSEQEIAAGRGQRDKVKKGDEDNDDDDEGDDDENEEGECTIM